MTVMVWGEGGKQRKVVRYARSVKFEESLRVMREIGK